MVSDVDADAGITGVSRAREFVCQEIMPKNEWSIWIDDNVSHITGLPYNLSSDKIELDSSYRDLFEQELSRKDMRNYLEQTVAKADSMKTIFCGFANENNYFFRANKWRTEHGYS